MNIDINSYSVRFSDGSIDHDATCEKFASDLLRFEELKDAENQVLAGHVHALFEQFKGARLNMPYLTGEILRRLNATPENYKTLSDKIQNWVRANSEGENAAFIISRGKGGGVARRADIK